jgi:hypothetical protein
MSTKKKTTRCAADAKPAELWVAGATSAPQSPPAKTGRQPDAAMAASDRMDAVMSRGVKMRAVVAVAGDPAAAIGTAILIGRSRLS